MIERIVLPRDILEDDAQAIVIPVNCVGVMGKGLALQAKERYAELFINYKAYCDMHMLAPGGVFGMQTKDLVTGKKKLVICLATKDHWHNPSQLDWIREGVNNLLIHLKKLKVSSVATPLIGTGLGQLDRKSVEHIICEKFSGSDIEVRIYFEPPRNKQTERNPNETTNRMPTLQK